MTSQRSRHGVEEENTAYRLQVLGAREGAIKGTLVAGALVTLLHYRFPLVRRQTLAGKAFLTSWGTIYGLVIYADKYLLEWEEQHRAEAEAWRNIARSEMAASGTIPSESAMRAWKARKDAEAEAAERSAGSPVLAELSKLEKAKDEQVPAASPVLVEVEKARQALPQN